MPKEEKMTVAVVGGGASGLTAALTAARGGYEVYLLERQTRVGKKLAVTGNGRCNLANSRLSAEFYHGHDTAFAETVLQRFDTEATLRFFKELGLLTVTEDSGRIYPLSDQAGSVVDVLRFAAEEAGVKVRTEFEVVSVKKNRPKGFSLYSADTAVMSDKMIICCGGMAGGKAGGGKSGYELLQSLGHTATKLYPALVQIKTDNKYVRSLKGVRADGKAALCRGTEELAVSTGEIQFTDYGVSGPAVFDISRAVSTAKGELTLHIDLLRNFSQKEVQRILETRRETMTHLTTENFMVGLLHNRIGRTVLQYAGYDLVTPVGKLRESDISRIAAACKDFTLNVERTLGFEAAQVTAGGIRTAEFDPQTMQSLLVPGLYAAGEVLDIDGDCGGYNLQWAWASGRLAGLLL